MGAAVSVQTNGNSRGSQRPSVEAQVIVLVCGFGFQNTRHSLTGPTPEYRLKEKYYLRKIEINDLDDTEGNNNVTCNPFTAMSRPCQVMLPLYSITFHSLCKLCPFFFSKQYNIFEKIIGVPSALQLPLFRGPFRPEHNSNL